MTSNFHFLAAEWPEVLEPTGNQNEAFSRLVPSSATGESAR
jgi:hypothetical protein